jgi:cation diffusion facilitator CzcD-associated flavoprotein CzcO
MCLIPNGDLFEALKKGEAEIVTDHIERFDATGIQLKSGEHLDADIIVTATGLNLVVLGNIDVSVDGETVNPAECFSYEAMMMSGVPNSAAVFGYVNASWTLRADLIAEFVCRLVNEMDARGMRQVTAISPDGMARQPWINFASGYFQRVMHKLPSQGDRDPWLNHQDYARDRKVLPTKSLDDLEFSNPIEIRVKEAAE